MNKEEIEQRIEIHEKAMQCSKEIIEQLKAQLAESEKPAEEIKEKRKKAISKIRQIGYRGPAGSPKGVTAEDVGGLNQKGHNKIADIIHEYLSKDLKINDLRFDRWAKSESVYIYTPIGKIRIANHKSELYNEGLEIRTDKANLGKQVGKILDTFIGKQPQPPAETKKPAEKGKPEIGKSYEGEAKEQEG